MPIDQFPDFSGKLVVFYLVDRPNRSYMLEDATFDMQAGRLFVVGKVSKEYDDDVWARGSTACLAWDCVEQYLIFESAAHYHRERERYEAAKEEKPSWS